ncbi:MAG: prepilin-type N-terminal cleavage/methylation domain-containing protein [Candidatus Sulfobium sp.]|jgi:type II secretory pathway pseudopilin PulG
MQHLQAKDPGEEMHGVWQSAGMIRHHRAGNPGNGYFGRPVLGSEGGFTLLELVVAFAILGFIVVIIAGAMRLGIRSVDSGEKRIDSLERLRTSLNILDSQVQSETPLTKDDNGEKKLYFQGERDSMQFATNYSIWGGQTGYVVVNYRVEADADGKQALAASENVIGIDEERDTRLFTGMDSIYFEYFYKGPTDEKGSWIDTWTDDTGIPEKVKVHLVQGRQDFSLIIPMRTFGSIAESAGFGSSRSGLDPGGPFERLLQGRH